MAEKLTTGFTKSVKFISTDWQRAINTVPAGTATYQYQFATSVVHPLRVWALFYPLVDYTNSGATPTESLFHPSYAPGVQCALFTQTNLLVNNVPYFRQNFQNQQDSVRQISAYTLYILDNFNMC